MDSFMMSVILYFADVLVLTESMDSFMMSIFLYVSVVSVLDESMDSFMMDKKQENTTIAEDGNNTSMEDRAAISFNTSALVRSYL